MSKAFVLLWSEMIIKRPALADPSATVTIKVEQLELIGKQFYERGEQAGAQAQVDRNKLADSVKKAVEPKPPIADSFADMFSQFGDSGLFGKK